MLKYVKHYGSIYEEMWSKISIEKMGGYDQSLRLVSLRISEIIGVVGYFVR